MKKKGAKKGAKSGSRQKKRAPKPETGWEIEKYISDKMLFVPRFLRTLSYYSPDAALRFADYYETGKKDGNLLRKHKELIFTAIGVATASPRCIVHVIPAIKAGATEGEIVEAALVGLFATGFHPRNIGIPYAIEYAVKAIEIAQKYRRGEAWEYLTQEEYRG